MEIFNVIKKPLITEKTQKLELTWVYTVEVNPNATKVDIKNAFGRLYWVDVKSVNIVKTQAKYRNTRTWIASKRKPSVKALVSLKKWQKIEDYIKLKIKD